eukprot:984082-Rhodomonas_salina.2
MVDAMAEAEGGAEASLRDQLNDAAGASRLPCPPPSLLLLLPRTRTRTRTRTLILLTLTLTLSVSASVAGGEAGGRTRRSQIRGERHDVRIASGTQAAGAWLGHVRLRCGKFDMSRGKGGGVGVGKRG